MRRSGGEERVLPLAAVLALVTLLWYLGAILLNRQLAEQRLDQSGAVYSTAELIGTPWSLDRPVLPAPPQISPALSHAGSKPAVPSRRSLATHAYGSALP